MGTQLLLTQRGTAPQFSAHIRCGQKAASIKMPLGMEEGLGPGDFVLDGDPAHSSPKRSGAPPIFGPRILWPNVQDANWYGGRHRPTQHCVRWGPSSPSPKGVHFLQFSANVRCGQTAGWTKMSLGMEVGLGPGDFVLDGDPATARKKAYPPPAIFGQCLLWPNGWMDQDATWYGGKRRPRRRCARWGRSSS